MTRRRLAVLPLVLPVLSRCQVLQFLMTWYRYAARSACASFRAPDSSYALIAVAIGAVLPAPLKREPSPFLVAFLIAFSNSSAEIIVGAVGRTVAKPKRALAVRRSGITRQNGSF